MKRRTIWIVLCIVLLLSYEIQGQELYEIYNLKGEIHLDDASLVTVHWNNDPKILEDIEQGKISNVRMTIDVKLDQGPFLSEQGRDMFSEDIMRLSHTFNPFMRRKNSSTKNTMVTIRLFYTYDMGGERIQGPYSETISLGHNSYIKNGREWSKEYLDLASKIGLLTENMMEDILRPITRYEFIKMLMKVDEYIAKHNYIIGKSFHDTGDKDINGAYNLGIVNGVEPGVFGGERQLTKEELSVIVYRYLKLLDQTMPLLQTMSFADATSVAPWAREAVSALEQSGIVQGDEFKNFNPKRKVTCEEATVMVIRILNQQ
ncbi:MAG: S-layer homology domain-containing protein [Tissierellia bacterium]|nr:S-layer homology domain-containing protein [Tissierellia bacterium]